MTGTGPTDETGSRVLEVSRLSRSFGARKALRDVSFALEEGSRLAVFGPNGAGKTTLVRILATLDRPSSGGFRAFGFDPREDADGIRSRIALVSHRPMLYLDLTARENLVLFGRLYGIAEPAARAAELLELVGLSHRANDVCRGFSRGMLQRLALARALVNNPELVFLDEPYSGLDPHAARIVDGLLDGPAARSRTVVTVSHRPERDYARATHALLLARGRQVLFSRTADLSEADFMAEYERQVGGR